MEEESTKYNIWVPGPNCAWLYNYMGQYILVFALICLSWVLVNSNKDPDITTLLIQTSSNSKITSENKLVYEVDS